MAKCSSCMVVLFSIKYFGVSDRPYEMETTHSSSKLESYTSCFFLLCNVMLFKYHFKAVHSHKINRCLVGGMCSTQANMNLVETANSAQFYSVHVSVLTSHIIWNELEHFISDMNMNKTQTHQNKHQFSTNLTCEALLFPLRFHVQVTYPSQSHRSKYFWLVTWTC